jgi:septum formation protein
LKTIILASGSPRRKKLLQQINIPFRVDVSSAPETYAASLSASEVVETLAQRKAKDVAGRHRNTLVIGADTIVLFENNILEKPESPREAEQMLQSLSGQTHQVLTGVALCVVGASHNITDITTFYETTNVIFGDINATDISRYVATGSPMDKAGGYGIQDDYGAIFVKRIEGDYYNVVGFPLHRFYNELNRFAPEFLSQKRNQQLED